MTGTRQKVVAGLLAAGGLLVGVVQATGAVPDGTRVTSTAEGTRVTGTAPDGTRVTSVENREY